MSRFFLLNRRAITMALLLTLVFASVLTTHGQAAGSPITVWIDSTRQAAVDKFIAANPDAADLIKVEIVDRATFPAKVLLFNNTNSGWPDVVFAEPGLVAQVSDASRDFPLDLRPFVDAKILANFATGANGDCILPDGKLVCLRNDLAQNVLWYNVPLMKQFGYSVPTTWEEYQALGEKVAKEHPGYLIGAFGDGQAMNNYFWSSGCPTGQLVNATTVYINTADPKCTRAAAMVDVLVANGSVSKSNPFDPAFIAQVTSGKLLMIPGASWYGEYIFGGKKDSMYFQTATGQLGVALPPKWAADPKALTGAQGGAAWTVSKHTQNPELATKFVLFVTTDNGYQGTAPTFPAYTPAATLWAKTLTANPVYAQDPFPVLQQAAGLYDATWGNVRYDRAESFQRIIIAAMADGKTVTATLKDWQADLVNLAQAQGYQVVTTLTK